MIRVVLRRLTVGLGLGLAVALGSLAIPFVVLLSRRGVASEVASGASCLLNALTGGPRRATFSAWSWELLHQGKRGAGARVTAVDALNGQGHCLEAWASHRIEGLIPGRRPHG